MSTWIKKLTEAFSEVNEKKKMDPVGQEDGDIDNDGDKDSSDEYLAKRRKAIGKAMKENDDEGEEKMECPKCKGEGCDHCDGKGYHMKEAYESVAKEMKKMHDEGYGKKAIMAKYNHMDKATLEKLYASSCGGMRESAMAQKAKDLAKASEPSAKGKKSVTLPKAPWDKKKQKNEEEVIMNPKKEKDKKAEADTMANESFDLDEDVTHQTVKPPNHTKKYTGDEHAFGAGSKKPKVVTSSQADAHDKTADHHRTVADAHRAAAKKTSSMKLKHLHNTAANAHDKAAEAHNDSSHSSDGSLTKTAGHMSRAYHSTMSANNASKIARNLGTKTKRMNEESALPPVYARILEERAKHYKGATPPEGMMDNSKSSKGAMDMVNQPKKINNDDEKGHDDVSKAGRVGPSAKARPGDNMKGDKKVIPSATPMKGK